MINDSERKYLIECLANGKDIPEDFKEKLFPVVKREYEILYSGKMRKSDILADEDGTFAVPLQVEKIYNGKREAFDDGWRNLLVFGDTYAKKMKSISPRVLYMSITKEFFVFQFEMDLPWHTKD